MIALLYRVQVRRLSTKKVEITLVPNWLGQRFKRPTRVGTADRAKCTEGQLGWFWSATDRHVGGHVERYIEAAPVLQVEDMSVEQLLLGDP